MVSRSLCVCMCVSCLSWLGLWLSWNCCFMDIVRAFSFQNCCFYSPPPTPSVAVCILCHKGFCEGLRSEYGVQKLILRFGLQANPLELYLKRGKREWKDEKGHFNERAKNRSHIHCLSGNVTGERNSWGHVWQGKHEKILHIKTKYWFPAWVRVGLERPTTSAHSPHDHFFEWGRVENKNK